MISKKIKRYLLKLQKMYKKLENKGGPSEAGNLFEDIIALEETILAMYKLKPTTANTNILQTITQYDEATDWIQVVEYLLTTAQQDEMNENRGPLEFLAKGIALSEDPGDVIPNMGLSLHDYTIFLYNLLQKGQANTIEVYNEMMKSKDLLEQIYLLKNSYENLKKKNINFLESYLQSDLYTEKESDQIINSTEETPINSSSNADMTSSHLDIKSSNEMIGRIINVNIDERSADNTITLAVSPVNEVELYSDTDDNKNNIHMRIYTMTISKDNEGYSMMPDDELEECMEILHEYEYSDNLNPTLRRKWKTATIADNIAYSLFTSNIFGIWNSGNF